MESRHYDFIIVGSGAGGGTIAHALAATGKRILIIERGGYLKRSKDNWDPFKVFREGEYNTTETWYTGSNRPFRPRQYYCVGGSTKYYGGVLIRFRKEDFNEVRHPDGISRLWPIAYEDMEPYYTKAEQLYGVHGVRGEDITEPPASADYPTPPISHEPVVQEIFDRFKAGGLHPSHSPLGIDLIENDMRVSPCIRCDTCDGFPCLADAKADTDRRCLRPALKHKNVEIVTETLVRHLETDPSGRVVESVVCATGDGGEIRFKGDIVILSAGAINSAVVLFRSRNDRHPRGLANGSGMVGRNLMFHNASAMLAINPFRSFEKNFLKTLVLNDFYLSDPFDVNFGFPLGNVQLMGNATSSMLKAVHPLVPWVVAKYLANHSLPWYASTEDIPSSDNKVELRPDGEIRVCYRRTNRLSHRRLLSRLKEVLRPLGFRAFITRKAGPDTLGHQCGTTRMGTDPSTSVINLCCKAHELDNLYVVDSGFFPSSSALNPALTVIANALRVADHLMERTK